MPVAEPVREHDLAVLDQEGRNTGSTAGDPLRLDLLRQAFEARLDRQVRADRGPTVSGASRQRERKKDDSSPVHAAWIHHLRLPLPRVWSACRIRGASSRAGDLKWLERKRGGVKP